MKLNIFCSHQDDLFSTLEHNHIISLSQNRTMPYLSILIIIGNVLLKLNKIPLSQIKIENSNHPSNILDEISIKIKPQGFTDNCYINSEIIINIDKNNDYNLHMKHIDYINQNIFESKIAYLNFLILFNKQIINILDNLFRIKNNISYLQSIFLNKSNKNFNTLPKEVLSYIFEYTFEYTFEKLPKLEVNQCLPWINAVREKILVLKEESEKTNKKCISKNNCCCIC